MPSLSDLYAGESKATLAINGHLIEIWYDPTVWTNQTAKAIAKQVRDKEEGDDTATDYNIELFMKLIRRWNLTESDTAKELPITRSVLNSLPNALINAMTNAIIKSMASSKNGLTSNDS